MYDNSRPQKKLSLPPGCTLRQANSADQWSIILLVISAKLDPTQLRWQQFAVIEFAGNLIACGPEMLNYDTKLYINNYTDSKKPKNVNMTSSPQTNEHN